MQTFGNNVFQANVREMAACVILNRQILLDGLHQLASQLHIFQFILMHIRHMHTHATANIAADNRR
ncbi:hypothetical protein D3C72_2499850 [compost metagenome]